MNTQLQGTARVGADPELRRTQGGKAVCELRLAFSSSTRVKGSDPVEYRDSPPVWVSCTLWETYAEHAAEVFSRGDQVLAVGQLELEQFEKRDGTQGEKLVLKNADVTPMIRRGVPGAIQRGSAQRQQARPQQTQQRVPVGNARPPADNPWDAGPPADEDFTGTAKPPY
jgi:single-strand DNA-binding protein